MFLRLSIYVLGLMATLFVAVIIGSVAAHAADSAPTSAANVTGKLTCAELVNTVSGGSQADKFQLFCEKAARLNECTSNEGTDIHHIDSKSSGVQGRKILVFALIHGDEPLSGTMAFEWFLRLSQIEARNQWRIIPILNPDGLRRNTRMNARSVDLNRNFPTKDWDDEAQKYWKTAGKGDKRRFPGDSAASEPETKCAVAHIKDFKPDFIVSIHTPYGVLDFDGPKISFPKYGDLAWRALGNFPGSLGRYMWKDHQLPVLTIEMKDKLLEASILQDVIGTVAIQASKMAKTKPDLFELL